MDKFEKQMVEDFCASLEIDKEKDILIVDPLMIHLPDLKDLGFKNIVRLRRPGWGAGNIKDCFMKVSYKEFKNALLVAIEEEEDG